MKHTPNIKVLGFFSGNRKVDCRDKAYHVRIKSGNDKIVIPKILYNEFDKVHKPTAVWEELPKIV